VVRVWVEIYPLKPAQAQASRPHFQRTGAGRVRDCGVSPGSSRSTRPAAGRPQHRMDSPAAGSSLAALQTAWPGCSVDHRNRTLQRDSMCVKPPPHGMGRRCRRFGSSARDQRVDHVDDIVG
jgi:hypothetical protein